MKKYLLIILVMSSCSLFKTQQDHDAQRSTASLDNNGDKVDDSFDSNLETYYMGSAEVEKKKIEIVSQVIGKFIKSQVEARRENYNIEQFKKDDVKKLYGDIPSHAYATRDVHRKTNGCYKASLSFDGNLMENLNNQITEYKTKSFKHEDPRLSYIQSPQELGVFTPGKTYDAIVRLSNGNPSNSADRVPDARGFAVKLLPQGTIDYEKPVSAMDATDLNRKTQLDILSINFPTFFVNDPEKYETLNRWALNGAKDFNNFITVNFGKAAGLLNYTAIERKLALLVNGSVIYSPLYEQYYSMVPSRLGPQGAIRAVKYSWQPTACSPADQAEFNDESKTDMPAWIQNHNHILFSQPEAYKWEDDYLRQRTQDRLLKRDACFGLYFQLYRDPISTNIEDSLDLWARSADEKKWWINKVTPGNIEWIAAKGGLRDSRSQYIQRINSKNIAPGILAAKLVIKRIYNDRDATQNPDGGYIPASGNTQTCEDLSFNPWNGNVAYHKPLGIVSRMKRKVYNESRRMRHKLNGIDDSKIERK